MRTCLFGGSFDPVHEGHIAIAKAAVAACGLERVVFLPAACSPFKQEARALFSPELRLAMLRKATQGMAQAVVSDLDLRLPPPSWSWRLVESYRAAHPQDELYWLLGTDQWELLHLWARPEYLAEQLTFIVYHRGSEPEMRPGVRAHFLPGPEHAASASAIRADLLAGRDLPPGWLHPQVEKMARKALQTQGD